VVDLNRGGNLTHGLGRIDPNRRQVKCAKISTCIIHIPFIHRLNFALKMSACLCRTFMPISPRPRRTSSLSESLNRQLNTYAQMAAAAGVSVLAIAGVSEAEVVYTETS